MLHTFVACVNTWLVCHGVFLMLCYSNSNEKSLTHEVLATFMAEVTGTIGLGSWHAIHTYSRNFTNTENNGYHCAIPGYWHKRHVLQSMDKQNETHHMTIWSQATYSVRATTGLRALLLECFQVRMTFRDSRHEEWKIMYLSKARVWSDSISRSIRF